ncbi:hypothetical protein MJM99_28885, partial [Salmonella enterica subsp. enterica serovar Kentucky]|nr:hypothetical protein [Salmonella enterica subsp. enterica serovar Kentucky]
YQAAQQLLQAHPNVDGVLVLIDTFASGAVRAFQEQAVAIPERYVCVLWGMVSLTRIENGQKEKQHFDERQKRETIKDCIPYGRH